MTNNKKRISYVVCAYGFFWLALLLIGVVLLLVDEGFQGSIPFRLLTSASAWTPTLALFVLFKKLNPGSSIKEFYKNAFRERLKLKMILFTTVTQLLILFSAAGIFAFTSDVAFLGLFNLSLPALGISFVWNFTSGPTGEQSGWRGFLQPNMEKDNGVIMSSIFVGVIWGFWHAPLWFLTSGYLGIDLVQWIIAYMVAIVSAAIIIGICYSRCRNLFVPIWIHFMHNFALSGLSVNAQDMLSIFTVSAALYALVAIGYSIWHRRSGRQCTE